jgi:ketosteroid isomerase-like protein
VTNADIVRLYYEKIDQQDVDWVIGIFARDSQYQRADSVYDGKDAIAQFYRTGRKIRGAHTVAGILNTGEQVVAHGKFTGFGSDGKVLDVGFCDIWTFKDSAVSLRQTYLALGADFVK